LEDWNDGRMEYWNAGMMEHWSRFKKPIIPLIQHSIIPMAFSGGILNGN
jgi:hypothetical protein